jgi:2,3-bisphosphoglycerate-independent phosphoglycerate mutase
MANKQAKPVILISLDGWGISPIREGNAIELADTKHMKELMRNYPFTMVEASGIAVGLPWGEVGNSEVGHLNLGAGQVVYQNLPRIQLAIQDKTFFSNKALLGAIEHAEENGSNLHLVGIASNGGVHGHIEHLHAILKLCKERRFKKRVYIHCITDGRDTPPAVAANFIEGLQEVMKANKVGEIVSLVGRYYAMDRNNSWERTKLAYDLMVKGLGLQFRDPLEAIKEIYQRGMTDEQLAPTVMVDKKGQPLAVVGDNDAVVFWNYRPDRARQLTQAFVSDNFKGFEREKLKNLKFVTMMEYESGLPVDVVFQPQFIQEPVGKIIADAGLKQLRLAETEKYAHVTYFFNGGAEDPFKKEERVLIPSPNVATYDLKPEMSAPQIADRAVKEIKAGTYDFILINFANADMVGHTGILDAAIKGVEAVDEAVGKVTKAAIDSGGVVVITADHGNAEQKIDPLKGTVTKEHTTSVVPMIVVDASRARELDEAALEVLRLQINPIGILADVGPTVLALMGLNPSKEMTGRNLLNDLM